MSSANGLLAGFPQQITAGVSKGVRFEQKPGYFALHGGPLPIDRAVVVFESEGIAVLRGAPSASLAPGQAISPVYAPEAGASLAVPTGRIFIRFTAGTTVEAHRAALEQAGFSIAEVLDYAPQAAWLRARSGRITDALRAVSTLERMTGVESIEVQLLMQRSPRQSDPLPAFPPA